MTESHLSRVCGLKFAHIGLLICYIYVTPFTGVWVEISVAGEWPKSFLSHLSRVCGLKFLRAFRRSGASGVTPFTGVWVEILILATNTL